MSMHAVICMFMCKYSLTESNSGCLLFVFETAKYVLNVMFVDHMPVDEVFVDVMSAEKMIIDKINHRMSSCKMSVDKKSVGKMSVASSL
jgi:hypothetical protein